MSRYDLISAFSPWKLMSGVLEKSLSFVPWLQWQPWVYSSQSPASLSPSVTPSTFHYRLKTHLFHNYFGWLGGVGWLGSVAVGRWTRDQEVADSTPTAALFGQQPWASCSHLMCLCSPSSITWYLTRAFLLKAPYCWQRHRVQWTRGYCRAVLRWSSDCVEPWYKSSALPLPFTFL